LATEVPPNFNTFIVCVLFKNATIFYTSKNFLPLGKSKIQ
jgi:hypothetical protein